MARTPRHLAAPVALLLVAAAASACGSSSSSTTSSAASGRPSSPATVRIVQPADGAVIVGSTVHVAVTVTGATIVQATTTNIRPDQGHVHLFLDSNLTYMSYTLQQDLSGVAPGTYQLRAEFVASDHAPFSPRVMSPTVLVTVRAG